MGRSTNPPPPPGWRSQTPRSNNTFDPIMWTCSISTCWEKRFSQTPPSPSGCRPNKITGDKNFGDSASASNGCPLNVPAGELEAMQKQLDLLTELQFRRHAHRGKLGQNSADAPRAGNSRAWAGSAVPWNWWFQIFSYCATNNQICCICHPSFRMKSFFFRPHGHHF